LIGLVAIYQVSENQFKYGLLLLFFI